MISVNVFAEDILEKDLIIIDKIYYNSKNLKYPFTGNVKEYWENGMLKYKESYVKGKKNSFEEYYFNGSYKSKAIYKNGVLDGLFEEFYNNGNIQSRGNFKKGNLDGPFYIYFKNGSIMQESDYINGKQVSCEGMCKRN